MLTPRDIAKWGRDLSGRSDAAVDAALQSLHCDSTERAAVRIEIDACRAETRISASLATDQNYPPGTLATDVSRHTPEMAPLSPELRALFRKAQLETTGRSYSQMEVEDLLTKCQMGPTERIAVKAEMLERGWLRAATARHVRASWDLQASAERPRGQVLRDPRTGQPAVLRS